MKGCHWWHIHIQCIYENLKNDKRIKYPDAAIKEGISSILSLPVKCKNSIIGLLKCYHSKQILIHEDDIESIKIILEQLGLRIEINGMKNFMDTIKATIDNLPLYITEGF
ncbi:MAG: GAF domain-containing protein [Desulfosarcina sp.]|nr:GAF domain-containing protein [Desulfobacterales bacterium]